MIPPRASARQWGAKTPENTGDDVDADGVLDAAGERLDLIVFVDWRERV